MSILINLAAILVGILLIYVITKNMKNKKIAETQSIGWLMGSLIIIFLGIFPKVIPLIAGWLGVWYPPTIFFVVVMVLLVFIVFQHTTSISQLMNHVNELTMQVTLLKDENESLKKQLSSEKE